MIFCSCIYFSESQINPQVNNYLGKNTRRQLLFQLLLTEGIWI